MTRRRPWLSCLLVAAGTAACSGSNGAEVGDATTASPAQGSERGSCYPNDTCNAGLSCLSSLCVNAGSGSSSGSGTFADAPDLGSSGGGSDSGPVGGGQQYMFTADGGIAATGPCPGGGSTTISGKIYDPAARNVLYGAVAYVPTQPVSPFQQGPSCAPCNSLYTGSPIAAGQTDATGSFVIPNAPSGTNIPLVIQLGKWRRMVSLNTVTACKDNPQPDRSLRLPASHMEGDIPNIAVSTGGADTLECLLLRMGVEASEYEPGAQGPGRIHIFAGGSSGTLFGLDVGASPNTSPAGPASSAALWDSDMDIGAFDIVMLSCEGSETAVMNQQVLFDYAKGGGRVFASHFHYAWFNSGPFAAAANLATWTAGANPVGSGTVNSEVQTSLLDGGPFPKGLVLNRWLGIVGALGDGGAPTGELSIKQVDHNANLSASNTASTSWIVPDPSTTPAPTAGTTLSFSFNTPLGTTTEAPCGRVIFGDMHAGGDSADDPSMPVPAECSNADLSPQEKALEFMLFDLSACVVPDNALPPPVQIVAP